MGEGRKKKTVGNRDIRSVERRGMGQGTQSKQDGHHRDFKVIARQGHSGREAENLKRWVWGGLAGVEKIVVLDRGR